MNSFRTFRTLLLFSLSVPIKSTVAYFAQQADSAEGVGTRGIRM